jgi:phenylacetate-coenzyme A ligase PaaK-like adenylate-forming protein
MTKDDLMANWDGIVTDPRLSLDRVEEHLLSLSGDAYLLDRYHAVASSGSSGRRGVFVYDWEAWLAFALCLRRYVIPWAQSQPGEVPEVAAALVAERASHLSSASMQTFSDPLRPIHLFSVSLPLHEIVAGLNQLQPTVIVGYPSLLHRLAGAAREGSLRIALRRIHSVGEQLEPEVRSALEATFEAAVFNEYTSSEGAIATACGHADGGHVADDLIYLEPYDEQGRPCGVGTPSASVYLTNLFNLALPLIRFEIRDRITILEGPCPCGSAQQRIGDVAGRLDDVFVYPDGVRIQSIVFELLLEHRSVLDYQVRQSRRGVEVRIQPAGELRQDQLPGDELRQEVEAALARAGLRDPEVVVIPVDHLERGATGKRQRFYPLDPAKISS